MNEKIVVNSNQIITNFGEKMKNIDVQFNTIKYDNRKISSSPYKYQGAICTFIDDDTGKFIPDIWDSIIAEKNIKMGFACPTGIMCGDVSPSDVGLEYTQISLEKLKQLYNDGHDVYSHSYSHPPFYSDSVTVNMIEEQCRKSKEWLENNGFNRCSDIIVYPGGLGQSKLDKKNVIRKYYKYGIDTVGNGANPDIVDNYCIYRINADTSTLDELKLAVDKAYTEGKWLVFMNHAYELNKDKINQVQKIKDLIDYINSKSIPILPFSEAEKYKGNSIFIGEYTDEDNFIVNSQGESTIKNVIFTPMSSSTFNPLSLNIDYFKTDTISVSMVDYVRDTFRGKGGVLKTYKNKNLAYCYQEFVTIDTNEVYTRFWDSNSNSWSQFKPATTKNVIFINKETSMDKSIIEYQSNSITISYVEYTKDTFKSNGGTLITYRLGSDSYSYQTYTPYNKSDVYIRKWNGSSWDAWVNTSSSLIVNDSIVDDSIFNNPITSYSKNKEYSYMVSNSQNAPIVGSAGIYKVYRYQDDLFSYSTWKSQASESLYGRRWVSGQWTAWVKING